MTVHLFNEGVDIPAVDTLLFVRPTESLTVFVQQIGRGLRLHPGKSHCTIIDLIGNYRNQKLQDGAALLPAVAPDQAAHYFHDYLSAKEYRKKIDLTDDLWVYNEGMVASLIARMPMSMWVGSSKGWAEFEDGQFRIRIHDEPSVLTVLHEWTQQICDYRLHTYFERKQQRGASET